jgi:hypothetical protein
MFFVCGCSNIEQVKQNEINENQLKDQLNISVLIDLSDRIKENQEKDQELIKYIAEYFKTHFEKKNLYLIRDQIKVLFYPEPENEKINTIAESLKIKLDPSNKEAIKNTWENIIPNYTEKLSVLYNFAEEEGKNKGYPGSDIWRFFNDKVHDYCIEPDPQYRNVLIILTDGYLYHKNSQSKEQNRTTYLTGSHLNRVGIRNNPKWNDKIEEEDFGFITKRNDLDNLEVLVLEINSSEKHRNDHDIIKKYWSKWFEEMNVKKHKLYTTDLPSNTKELINIFLSER